MEDFTRFLSAVERVLDNGRLKIFFDEEIANETIALCFQKEDYRPLTAEVFKGALTCLKSVSETVREQRDDGTWETCVVLVAETLFRHAEGINLNNATQSDERVCCSLALAVFLCTTSLFNEVGRHIHDDRDRPVLQLMYNHPSFYRCLMSSCGQCFRKLLSFEKDTLNIESCGLIEGALLLLLCVVEQLHSNAKGSNTIRSLRNDCALFLVCCSFSNEHIRNVAQSILGAVAASSLSSEQKLEFYAKLCKVFSSVVLDISNSLSVLGVQLHIGSIQVDEHYLQTVLFPQFLIFLGQSAHWFPAKERLVLLSQVLENADSFKNTKSKRVNDSLAVMHCFATYFKKTETVDYLFHDEIWDTNLRIVRYLIMKRWTRFDVGTSVFQLKAIFLGLTCLIRGLDVSLGEEKKARSVRTARDDALRELLQDMMECKQSACRAAMVEASASVQRALVYGWRNAINAGIDDIDGSSYKGFLFYVPLLDHLSLFLQPKYKMLWNSIFSIYHHCVASVQKLLEKLYSLSPTSEVPLCMVTLAHSCWLSGSPSESDFVCMLRELWSSQPLSFSQWYQRLRQILYSNIFSSTCSTLASLLRECEEPSIALLNTKNEQGKTNVVLKEATKQDTALYRNELQRCVGSCFETFGAGTMLEIPCISLNRLCDIPMSSPAFAYESNSWIIPLMCRFVSRDSLGTFLKKIVPLVHGLTKKANQLCKTQTEKVEARHYRRLIEQLWSLLPSFIDQAFDIIDVLSTDNDLFFNIIANNIRTPVIQNSICGALMTLSLHIGCVIHGANFLEWCQFPHGKSKRDSAFVQLLWNSDVNKEQALDVVKNKANKIMGILVVTYLQIKDTHTLEDVQSTQAASMLCDTIEALSLLCTSELLESNLHSFSSTWASSVNNAVALVVKDTSKNNPATQIQLSPIQCAALVDVCVALMNRLPNKCLYELFHSFLKVISDCAGALSNMKGASKHRPNGNGAGVFPNSEEPLKQSIDMLQHLLRKAYKGFYNALSRLLASAEHEDFLHGIQPSDFTALWKTILDSQAIARKINTNRSRVSVMTVAICLLARIKPWWDAELSSEIVETTVTSTISSAIPEILLGVSDVNKSVREKCTELVHCILNGLVTVDTFVTLLLPGFASRTACILSSTTSVFTLVLRGYGDRFSLADLIKLLSFTSFLLNVKNKSLFRATLKFFSILMRLVPRDTLLSVFREHIVTILASPYALSNRLSVRYTIEKALARIGLEELEKVFPSDHLPLLYYINRTVRKRQDKRHKQLNTDELDSEVRDYRGSFDTSYESDQDSLSSSTHHRRRTIPKDRMSTPGISQVSNLTNPMDLLKGNDDLEMTGKMRSKRKRCLTTKTCNEDRDFAACILDSIDTNPLSDDPTAARNILIRPAALCTGNWLKKQCTSVKSVDCDPIKIGPNGKLIIEEEEDHPAHASASTSLSRRSNKIGDTLKKDDHATLSGLKDTWNNKKQSRIKKGHFIEKSSDAFASKKAAGDVSRTNGVAPYSYIRLDPRWAKETYRPSVVKTFKKELGIKKRKLARNRNANKL